MHFDYKVNKKKQANAKPKSISDIYIHGGKEKLAVYGFEKIDIQFPMVHDVGKTIEIPSKKEVENRNH